MCLSGCSHYGRRVLCRVQLHSAKPLSSAALGKELSAYPFTAKASLPSAFCRALGKAFAECRKSTRQRFTLGKMKMRKKPKNNSKIYFFGEGRHRPAPVRPAPPAIEVAAFFAQNSRLTRPVGFELTTSPSRVCCSTTALRCQLCLNSVIYHHILY